MKQGQEKQLVGHKEWIWAVDVHSNGDRIVSGDNDG